MTESGYAPSHPRWSPRGDLIAFEGGGIWTVTAQAPHEVNPVTDPVYSPDGSWMAYAAQPADASSLPAVRLMNARTLASHATGTVGTPTSWRSRP